MVNDKEIRASAVKIIRYCLNTPDDVHRFVDTCLPTLIVRIIDTNYDENSFQDREHALKLIRYVNCWLNRATYLRFLILKQNFRKLLRVAPIYLPNCLITSLISIIICSSKPTEKSEKRQHVARDRLYRACIEIICEVRTSSFSLFIKVILFRSHLSYLIW